MPAPEPAAVTLTSASTYLLRRITAKFDPLELDIVGDIGDPHYCELRVYNWGLESRLAPIPNLTSAVFRAHLVADSVSRLYVTRELYPETPDQWRDRMRIMPTLQRAVHAAYIPLTVSIPATLAQLRERLERKSTTCTAKNSFVRSVASSVSNLIVSYARSRCR